MYDDAKARIKPGLDHHYANNDHHPEHFGAQGISGMNLYQLLEMWIDWTAAVKRHADGNIFNSLMYNKDREEFHMDDQLFNILLNTATEDFPDQMDNANEKFQKYLMPFSEPFSLIQTGNCGRTALIPRIISSTIRKRFSAEPPHLSCRLFFLGDRNSLNR